MLSPWPSQLTKNKFSEHCMIESNKVIFKLCCLQYDVQKINLIKIELTMLLNHDRLKQKSI